MKLNFDIDEILVHQQPYVIWLEQKTLNSDDELILSNKKLTYIHYGILGKEKNRIEIPLNSIQTINHEINVQVCKHRRYDWILRIFTKTIVYEFAFEIVDQPEHILDTLNPYRLQNLKKAACEEWRDKIIQCINKSNQNSLELPSIPKKNINKPNMKTHRCIGCHAPITNHQGSLIVCEYCGTEQVI